MTTFVMIARLSPEALRSPSALEDFETRAMVHVRDELPKVKCAPSRPWRRNELRPRP